VFGSNPDVASEHERAAVDRIGRTNAFSERLEAVWDVDLAALNEANLIGRFERGGGGLRRRERGRQTAQGDRRRNVGGVAAGAQALVEPALDIDDYAVVASASPDECAVDLRLAPNLQIAARGLGVLGGGQFFY
jgi:hypothetical protein